ncbi:MAG: hypothetical protein ACI3YT_00440 [Prevotella sp.]
MRRKRTIIYIIMCMLWLTTAAVSARTMASAADVRGYYSIMEKLPAKVLIEKGKELAEVKDMPDSALVCYSIIVNKYHKSSKNEELKLLMMAYHGQWYVYLFHYNDYAKAKETLIKYLKTCEKAEENKGRAYLMFGAMYETMANNTNEDTLDNDAKKYYRLAIHEAKKDNNKNVIINAFTNLVELCDNTSDLLGLGNEYEILKNTGRDSTLRYGYMFAEKSYLSSLYTQKGKFTDAIKYCDDIIENTPNDIGHIRYMLFAQMKRSRIYSKMGRMKEAIEEMKDVERKSEINDLRDGKILAYSALCEYYDSVGNK